MRPEYVRENLILTEFDTEDVITTSGVTPDTSTRMLTDNSFGSFGSFDKVPGSWY